MDIMLQTCHQSHAHRLVLYHNNKTNVSLFPKSGFGDEAVELGPRTNRNGPCLTLLRKVTARPEEFLSWFDSSLLKTSRCVSRVYFFNSNQTLRSREDLMARLVAEGPPKGPIRIQANPRELERWLGERLPEEFELNPKESLHVLEAVEAEGRVWYTIHTSDWLFLNSSTDSGPRQESFSKAHSKLSEALQAAGASLEDCREWCAVDFGAAPGSWTAILADKVRQVIAVDPAELDPSAMRCNVVHLRKKAEDCIAEIRSLSSATGGVDMLVCDINKPPRTMASVVRRLFPVLKSGALLILTFKFSGVGRDRSDTLEEISSIFGDDVACLGCLWLFANTVNERTLLARKT
mmetsp:Transcript_22350/g.53426  ORF Transcript_22350/g.53426 Transcript_22350/m.53426 type:complete len:349 (+) Transcript_22350:218-1264(+)